MKHVLDNPAWNALISGNRHLAYGGGQVRYFDKEVSPYAGFEENNEANFLSLYNMLPHNGPVLFVAPVETEIPAPWKVLQQINGLQMVFEKAGTPVCSHAALRSLTRDNVPEMLALTKLTNPGPFAAKTIDFGHYMGVFENGRLAAMAGRRLHVYNYMEVSAVCTHPDHTGKGYAKELLNFHISRILAESRIPFLGVRQDNERAIKVYESMGFVTRIPVYFYVLMKAGTVTPAVTMI